MGHHKYTEEQMQFLKSNVKGTSFKRLCELFNERFGTSLGIVAIVGTCKRHGLRNGIDTRLKPGATSFNKGKKRWWKGGEETQFKPGDRPHNYKPIGTEIVDSYGYLKVKVGNPNKWRHKHHLVYEAEHGPIPAGCAVIFLDSDKSNVTLNNLALVTRGQLGVLNHNNLIKNNAELTKLGIMIADIKMQKATLQKQKKGGESCKK